MKSIVKNSIVNKVLTIFLIGLVSRIGFNLVCDTGIFKDFNSLISVLGYGFMVCSSLVAYELPGININSIKDNSIRDVITSILQYKYFEDNKIYMGSSLEESNIDKDCSKEKDLFNSYPILNDKLSVLGLHFDVDNLKSIFPYKFANYKNLFYIGNKPSIDYYDGISNEDYNSIDLVG
jgi:hypothetical protein